MMLSLKINVGHSHLSMHDYSFFPVAKCHEQVTTDFNGDNSVMGQDAI